MGACTYAHVIATNGKECSSTFHIFSLRKFLRDFLVHEDALEEGRAGRVLIGDNWIPQRKARLPPRFIGFRLSRFLISQLTKSYLASRRLIYSLISTTMPPTTPPRTFVSRSSIWVMPRVPTMLAPSEDEASNLSANSMPPPLMDENLSLEHRIPSSTSVDSTQRQCFALRDLTNTHSMNSHDSLH